MPARALSVGDILAFPLDHGWSACQVLQVASKRVEVVSLDHWSAERPTLAAVTLRPLIIDHHFWKASLHHLNVSGPPPESFAVLGAAPVLNAPKPCNSYGGWTALPLQADLQLRWNAVPAAARAAFVAARDARSSVTLRLPSGEMTLAAGLSKIALEFGVRRDSAALHIERAADFDLGALDVLPVLLSVSVTGDAPGLLDWLRTRPLVEKLSWRGALPPRIDLRGTGLRECTLDADGAHEVVVPDTLEGLALTPSAAARWDVQARDDGALLALRLPYTCDGDGVAHVTGLRRARSLTLSGVGALDLRALAGLYHPRDLCVHGAPGELRGSDALAAFDALETLAFWRCLAVDAAHMPLLSQWPHLRRVDVVEALDAETAALKAAWGRDKRVSVRSPRDAAWARHHGSQPFRQWRDERKRADVGAAFASASKKLDAAGSDAPAVAKVMQGFVKGLTRAHTKGAGFTAAEVADIEAAWATLLARTAAVDGATAAAWLARGRKGW